MFAIHLLWKRLEFSGEGLAQTILPALASNLPRCPETCTTTQETVCGSPVVAFSFMALGGCQLSASHTPTLAFLRLSGETFPDTLPTPLPSSFDALRTP